MTVQLLFSIFQIILIDVVLSGDNAVVIAMAAHKLPEHQRRRAILWGGGIAIFLRIVFTMIMSFLLMVPLLRLAGGLLLVWIACKLLRDEEEEQVTADSADRSTLAAIKMIFLADFAMSLDNMLAVAGASHGNWKLLLGGLVISIAIIMTCSNLIAQLMNRYHWIVTLGAAILAFTAGEMMMGDRELAGMVVRNFQVSLDGHWDGYMVTHVHPADFPDVQSAPSEAAGAAEVRQMHADGLLEIQTAPGGQTETLTFVGKMTAEQREALQNFTTDKAAIDELFESSQSKWPAEQWKSIQGRQYHIVSWICFGLVIVFCLSSPRWWPGTRKPEAEPESAPPVASAS